MGRGFRVRLRVRLGVRVRVITDANLHTLASATFHTAVVKDDGVAPLLRLPPGVAVSLAPDEAEEAAAAAAAHEQRNAHDLKIEDFLKQDLKQEATCTGGPQAGVRSSMGAHAKIKEG